MNNAALNLPDPLLVRYYHKGATDKITAVQIDAKTRNIMVTLGAGAVENWKYLVDLGWIPITLASS